MSGSTTTPPGGSGHQASYVDWTRASIFSIILIHLPASSDFITSNYTAGQKMSEPFSYISTDSTELILAHLPIPSLVRASAVCSLFRTLISSPTFPSLPHHHRLPWFFLHGIHNTCSKYNQSFAFDPLSNSWFRLPSSPASPDFIGSGGFLFSTALSFSFSPLLTSRWKSTSPLQFSRINPLVGVFADPNSNLKFIVVGGSRFIGGLVDIEDQLAVEIYNPCSDSWDLCPPLPAEFHSGNTNTSSLTLTSALFKGSFYVFGIYSLLISSFDLDTRVWSRARVLSPPGVLFAFLIPCDGMLLLAGICNGPCFKLWRINEVSMEFSEIGIMPRDLLYGLVDYDDDDKFATLKCVGMGNLVYVFNEEYHKRYPACLCEISSIDSDSIKCSWKRLPQLPCPVNEFHRVVSFCSTVLPHTLF
ncbi:F-box/kelch-repeat protein At3g24760 [Linum grandiflorum]